MPLPVPRMSATITPPTRGGEGGRVEIHGARLRPPMRVPVARVGHHCSRCGAGDHNAKNKRCPKREVG